MTKLRVMWLGDTDRTARGEVPHVVRAKKWFGVFDSPSLWKQRQWGICVLSCFDIFGLMMFVPRTITSELHIIWSWRVWNYSIIRQGKKEYMFRNCTIVFYLSNVLGTTFYQPIMIASKNVVVVAWRQGTKECNDHHHIHFATRALPVSHSMGLTVTVLESKSIYR